MHTPAPSTRLLPRQTRLIHASEGLRIRVVSGRVWLTQPGAAQDLFLGQGDCADLLQDWVLVQGDVAPGQGPAGLAGFNAYELHPLVMPEPRSGWARAFALGVKQWGTRVAQGLGPQPRSAPAP